MEGGGSSEGHLRPSPDPVSSGRCPESSSAGQSSHPMKLPYASGAGVPVCSHYARHCAYVSPCCKKIYTCRVCHDENESHEIDRHAVTEIVCLQCHTRQHVARSCTNCGTEFGRYFCSICRLFDDNDLKQFHCDQCGLCRIGGRENFFHCLKCDLCLGIAMKDSHQCMEKRTHANCPVCLEDLHSSRVDLHCQPCGHLTHKECWKGLLKSGNYTCPLCCHSMLDMTEQWKAMDEEIKKVSMPDEYKNLRVWILCRDCHKVSETAFHAFGLKCCQCGSYNTCRSADNDTTTEEMSDETSATKEATKQP